MAEAVAFGASVAAFIQLTDRVINLCKRFVEGYQDAPKELRTALIETSSLKSILENLDFLYKTDSGFSSAIQSLTDRPIQGCQKSVEELENELQKLSISGDFAET